MKFYVYNDLVHLDNTILPKGMFKIILSDPDSQTSNIMIATVDNVPLTDSVPVNQIQKQNNLYYSSLDEFLNDNRSFFFNLGSAVASVFADTGEPSGFAIGIDGEVDRSSSIISFDNLTRTFSITPAVNSFFYYVNGTKLIVSNAKTVQIDDVGGRWFIYFDTDFTLKASNTISAADIILTKVIVATIYWDSVLKQAILGVFDERHGCRMDAATHLFIHRYIHTRYDAGLALNSFVIGNGTLNTHVQFTIDAGTIYDEDLKFDIPSKTSALPILYKGAGGFYKEVNNGYAFLTTGTGRLAYNNTNTNVLVEVTNNYFVCYHIVALGGNTPETGQIISVAGITEYDSLANAVIGAPNETVTIRNSTLISNESKIIATIILQTNSTYTNTLKAKIVQPSAGVDYLDWRTSSPVPTTISATDHDSLPGLSLAGAGVLFGHISDANQNISGIKNFVSGIKSKTIQLDTTYDITTLNEGQIAYNKIAKTISIGSDDPESTLEIGQEMILMAYNNTGAQINNGQPVYINGAFSNNPTVNLAIANSETTSFVVAVATANVPNNTIGRFAVHGMIHNIDTSAYTVGQIVYLSATVAGGITATPPNYPNARIIIGCIVKVDIVDGIMYVNTNKLYNVEQVIEAAQLVPKSTKVNGHELTGDITVLASEIGGSLPHDKLPTLLSEDIPNNASNTSGNAATATKLAAAVTINNVNFDGSGNITIYDSTKEPSINGSGNVTDFWSGTKTFRNLATDVRAVVLTGLNTSTNQTISATDNILVALGYLQANATNLANTKRTYNRVTFDNANLVMSNTTRYLAQIGTLTASRSITLPAANALSAGEELIIADESGTVTINNTLIINAAGSDTINGVTSEIINAANGFRRFITDGVNKWTFDGGIARWNKNGTINGLWTFDNTVTFNKVIKYTGIITPATLAANVNDYNPTGFSTCNTLRQNVTANRTITGFVAQSDGFEFTIFNIGTANIILADSNTSSAVGNRILGLNGANTTIRTQGSATLRYDGTTGVWRIKSAAL